MLAANSQDNIKGRHHIKVTKFNAAAGVVAPVWKEPTDSMG